MKKLSANARSDWHFIGSLLGEHPIKFFGGVVAFLGSIASIVGFFQQSSSGTRQYATSPDFLSVFPARVIAFIIIAISIGWTLSIFGIWVSARRDHILRIFAHVLTVICSIFLAACIDWIFADDLQRAPNLVLLFVTAGVALSIYFAKENYQSTLDADFGTITRRAELLSSFAVSAVVFVFVRQIAGV